MAADSAQTHRERQTAATRRLLLDAAHELLEEKGYDGATMRELAARAGVGVGTAFKHYPAKDSLVLAVYRDELYAAADALFDSLPEEGIAAQFLHLVNGLYAFFDARPALTRVMVTEASGLENESAEHSLRQFGEFAGEVYKLVEAAQGTGELRPDVDCEDVTAALCSFYYVGLVDGFTSPSVGVDARVARVGRLVRQHLRGVEAQP